MGTLRYILKNATGGILQVGANANDMINLKMSAGSMEGHLRRIVGIDQSKVETTTC